MKSTGRYSFAVVVLPALFALSVPATIEGGDRSVLDDCGLCSQYGPGPTGNHKFTDDTGTERACLSFPEEQEYCHPFGMQGGCYNQHYDCPGEDLIAAAETLLSRGDVKALARLQRDNPESIHINNSRQSVQVFDCNGEVVGHFPLSREVLAYLTD